MRMLLLLLLALAMPASAGLLTHSGSTTAAVSEDPGGDADSDFAARCAAPGVVYCNGFDSSGDLAEGTVGLNCNSQNKSSLNTTTKISGNSSLQFELTAGTDCLNVGGNWQYTYATGFGAGDDIYIQYRFRGSPEYFSNNVNFWHSTVKQLNVHGSSSSCQATELTSILYQQRIMFYRTCSGLTLITDPSTGASLSNCNSGTGGTCLLNQASQLGSGTNIGYNCNYQSQSSGDGNGPGCFQPVGDKWYTIYIHYDLNTFGGSDNGYYAWESHDGAVFKQFLNIDGDGTWSGTGDSTFEEFWLETYMSEFDNPASSTAYIMYDEFIISTQPIALPESF